MAGFECNLRLGLVRCRRCTSLCDCPASDEDATKPGEPTMTPQAHAAFLRWLAEQIAKAEKAAKLSGNFMRDSYGDGYRDGQLDMLKAVRAYFDGE